MYEALYERGMAVGEVDIKLDEMHFYFGKEQFTLPTRIAYPHAEWTGYFYQMPIEKVRELEREQVANE